MDLKIDKKDARWLNIIKLIIFLPIFIVLTPFAIVYVGAKEVLPEYKYMYRDIMEIMRATKSS